MNRGLTQVYTGDGKGKTTAAIGLAVRAAGNGLKVAIYQFCKGAPSGELNSLKLLERVKVFRAEAASTKFVWDMTEDEKSEWLDGQQTLFDDACEAACSGEWDLVVLDEALGACKSGAMTDSQLKYLMEKKARGTELVLTGRDAPQAVLEAADYITEMRALRHPYERGTHARRGIEY